ESLDRYREQSKTSHWAQPDELHFPGPPTCFLYDEGRPRSTLHQIDRVLTDTGNQARFPDRWSSCWIEKSSGLSALVHKLRSPGHSQKNELSSRQDAWQQEKKVHYRCRCPEMFFRADREGRALSTKTLQLPGFFLPKDAAGSVASSCRIQTAFPQCCDLLK